ncbi:unnamed protein product [Cylicocyclus nassatus]|uniref:Uncharacterized protein n=1 Tax=Cylicocyclus nassatus TaxID=53992 RepID=A0AA36DQ12_CYLNA|nr:unnamed protein product [Cylicocyclus nassatus]
MIPTLLMQSEDYGKICWMPCPCCDISVSDNVFLVKRKHYHDVPGSQEVEEIMDEFHGTGRVREEEQLLNLAVHKHNTPAATLDNLPEDLRSLEAKTASFTQSMEFATQKNGKAFGILKQDEFWGGFSAPTNYNRL